MNQICPLCLFKQLNETYRVDDLQFLLNSFTNSISEIQIQVPRREMMLMNQICPLCLFKQLNETYRVDDLQFLLCVQLTHCLFRTVIYYIADPAEYLVTTEYCKASNHPSDLSLLLNFMDRFATEYYLVCTITLARAQIVSYFVS